MPALPALLAISDRRLLGARHWSDWCAGLAAAGVDGLQVRERELDDGELLALVSAARRSFSSPRALFVNRRFDIALAAGADGVHLPAHGLPVALVRSTLGERLVIGRSTHDLDEVRRASEQGADYVVFGPIFDTPSKRGRLAPRGLAALAEAAAVGVPVLAIGGIDAARVEEVLRHGATGLAAIRAFATPDSAAAMVAASREARA
jgi:thiamine-phosphate pyrophosphorylase